MVFRNRKVEEGALLDREENQMVSLRRTRGELVKIREKREATKSKENCDSRTNGTMPPQEQTSGGQLKKEKKDKLR